MTLKSKIFLILFALFFYSNLYAQDSSLNKEFLSKNIYWGDLHAHSGLSFDSDCSTQALYDFAKNQSDLDFIVVSDHDVSSSENDWKTSKDLANRNNVPTKFAAFLGYEWTGRRGEIGGHRIIIYPDKDARRFSYESSAANDIAKITSLIAGENGLMIVAHPDIYKFHANLDYVNNNVQAGIEFIGGQSNVFEFFGNENAHSDQIKNNSARDALLKGHTFAAIGSSDSHDCKPGLGGLTAAIAGELTRKSIFEAVKNRRVYATTGARIRLDFYNDELQMGEIRLYSEENLPLKTQEFNIHVKGTAELSEVQVIKNSEVVHTFEGNSTDSLSVIFEDPNQIEGNTYYYVKVIQKDGEKAWSSPIFFHNEELYVSISNEGIEKNSILSSYNNLTDEIMFEIYLEENEYIEILVYDILGRKIRNLVSQFFPKGNSTFKAQTGNISSGVYLIQMNAKTFSTTSKVTIIK